MADPRKPPQPVAARMKAYRAGMRTDLRRLELKVDQLRRQVDAALKPCDSANRPARARNRP
jgi:hypothetical protein